MRVMEASHKLTNRRQIRCLEILAAYNFDIYHRPGKCIPVDGPSRHPDYARYGVVIHLDHSHTLRTYDKKLQYNASGADNPQGRIPEVKTGAPKKSKAEQPLVTSD